MSSIGQVLVLFLFLAMVTSVARAFDLQETKFVFFLQDIAAGPEATLVPVAGIPGKQWSFIHFGTIFVTDDYVTETADPDSEVIGRAQGMYVTSALDGSNSHVMISILFSQEEYSGSTLQIQGISRQLDAVREISVVSGTGKFRYARGYATFETYFVDIPKGYAVIRCNVTVLHS